MRSPNATIVNSTPTPPLTAAAPAVPPPPSSNAADSASPYLPQDEFCSDSTYSDASSTQVESQTSRQDLLGKLKHLENDLIEARNAYREMVTLKDGMIKILHDQMIEMPAMILSRLHQQIIQPT